MPVRRASKHLLWMLFEDIGIDKVAKAIKRKLTGLKIAPFYGCYILRPSEALGLRERPERKTYLERLIALLGAEDGRVSRVDQVLRVYRCSFNGDKALSMGGNHIIEAKEKGADLLVTPCPLCHLNLDGQQPDAAKVLKKDIGVPIFISRDCSASPSVSSRIQLRLDHHVVPDQRRVGKGRAEGLGARRRYTIAFLNAIERECTLPQHIASLSRVFCCTVLLGAALAGCSTNSSSRPRAATPRRACAGTKCSRAVLGGHVRRRSSLRLDRAGCKEEEKAAHLLGQLRQQRHRHLFRERHESAGKRADHHGALQSRTPFRRQVLERIRHQPR